MPPQIGCHISEAVYNGQLKSNLLHPVTDDILACRFIDIPGVEKRNGDSFMVWYSHFSLGFLINSLIQNDLECGAVLKLALALQEQQKEYQIITPYEGQRSTIENQMKEHPELDWENKCFNVDSFQG